MKKLILFGLLTFSLITKAQETLPIYSDYLSDNVFLVHNAAAGIGDCAKLRLTHRIQWLATEKAPSLQTISYHGRFKENSNVGLGAVIFNDRNGYHSQLGAQATLAYHINMSGRDFSQFSFAISGMYVENKIDETSFLNGGQFDPIITSLIKTENYFNADVGVAYHYKTGFAYLTIKNLLLSARELEDRTFQSLNVRKYLLSFGYFFDNENEFSIKLEPSIMAQVVERTTEKFIDFNLKAYKKLANNNTIWAALSYRAGLNNNAIQNLKQFTPIIGINLHKVLVSYTYTKQLGDIVFEDGGFHQFTLGLDLFCKDARGAACPNINNSFR